MWLAPASTATQSAFGPTRTGALRGVMVPSPRLPLLLSPQHQSWPERTPHVKLNPVVTAAQSLAPFTAAGVPCGMVVPSPS